MHGENIFFCCSFRNVWSPSMYIFFLVLLVLVWLFYPKCCVFVTPTQNIIIYFNMVKKNFVNLLTSFEWNCQDFTSMMSEENPFCNFIKWLILIWWLKSVFCYYHLNEMDLNKCFETFKGPWVRSGSLFKGLNLKQFL